MSLPTNVQLLQQIRESKEFGIATVELSESMIKIIRSLCQKRGFERPMYVDEVEILRKMLYSMPRRIVNGVTYTGTSVAPWRKFKEELSDNPFAYFVQCINGHIANITHREKKAIMNFCACMGPMGSDLHCPCKMKELGLPCSNAWTPEKIAELEAALDKYAPIPSNEEVVGELMATVSTMLDDLLVPLNVAKYAPKEPSELEKFQSIARGLREPKEIHIIDYISVLQPSKELKISEELYQECREIMSNHRIHSK